MEQTIYLWIKNLIEDGDIPLELVDSDFHLEDGMNLQEYWEYEKLNFRENVGIFNLNSNFLIEIFNKEKLNQGKTVCSFYVINSFKKIVFKMTITINDKDKVSSNNFISQIVPKYVIENNKIVRIGMAIKPKKYIEVENIISTELEKVSFGISASFDEDAFYNTQFSLEEEIQNKSFTFYLKYKGVDKKEKRHIFFDQFNLENCPYIINEDNTILSRDDTYPVNLAIYYKNGRSINHTYPRNIKETLVDAEKVIVTDVLDNDWILFF